VRYETYGHHIGEEQDVQQIIQVRTSINGSQDTLLNMIELDQPLSVTSPLAPVDFPSSNYCRILAHGKTKNGGTCCPCAFPHLNTVTSVLSPDVTAGGLLSVAAMT
jgi:hypothetical protein